MKKIRVQRQVVLPDERRLARYERAPEFGPNVTFFSGGSALNAISQELKKFTHNSVHLVTPFDSGGSSAVLRNSFDMPAIGDLRARMMALADESLTGNPQVFELFRFRLPKDGAQKVLRAYLQTMVEGKEVRIAAIKNPMRRLIRNHLMVFLDHMPDDFDLRGASIGNLILAAGYLSNHRQLDPVIFMFSKLVGVLGHVAPIVHDPLHLAVQLADGSEIYGQHCMTGKETAPLSHKINKMFLIKALDNPVPTEVSIPKKKRKLIQDSDLICYPPGSFYSSVLANLLPKGVGQVVSRLECPKIYTPSLSHDPECVGLSLGEQIFTLIEVLLADCGRNTKPRDVLSVVLLDSQHQGQLDKETQQELESLGIDVVASELVSPQTQPYYDPRLYVQNLLSFT